MTDVELQVKEISDKFSRLIRNLGYDNGGGYVVSKGSVRRKPEDISKRYEFEVDFAYALNAIKNAPAYIVQKHFDNANLIISGVINLIKESDKSPPTEKEA